MSALLEAAPAFGAFLDQFKDVAVFTSPNGGDPANTRFLFRNFLLEERIAPERAASYSTQLHPETIADFGSWNRAHGEYLNRHVFVKPSAAHDFRYLDPTNAASCPETFRVPFALAPFEATDLETFLLRLVPVSDIAYLSGANEDVVFDLGKRVCDDPDGQSSEHERLTEILEEAAVGPHSDVRPVFATFHEDFQSILEQPAPNWPDHLRDRLGLFHINQWQARGLPQRVFLFRYRVRDLPHQPGHAQTRLLAVPTVVDHRLSEAFCPAPRGLDRGRVVKLDVNLQDEPARELLHGHMLLNASHLYRVGLVTTPVPRDLAAPRRDHLIWLRMLAGRDDYAAATDGDLL